MITNYLDYVTLCSRMAEYHRTYHKDGVSPIPDVEYDRLRKDLLKWETDNPDKTLEISPTFKVGFIEPERRRNEELRHEYEMLSLENALNQDEHNSFVNLWVAKFGTEVEVIGEFKYDGLAISLRYVDGQFIRALTRGDGEYGEDVTQHMAKCVPETIMAMGEIEIRGEAIINKKSLETVNAMAGEKYPNARTAVCAIVNPSRKEPARTAFAVSFIPYDIEGADLVFNKYTDKIETLKQLGFQMHSCFIMTPGKIQEGFEQITKVREAGDLPFEVDGMVFKINDLKLQMELGETKHAPRHSFAYKFPPIVGECTLLNVVFQVGRSGEIAPVAKITATSLMGVLVTSVLLHNEERMKERKIAIGNDYEVWRSGDVIPHMGKVIREVPYALPVSFPSCCPACNAIVVKRGATYFCPNAASCPAQSVATLAYAVSREVLAIDGMAEKTVQLMLDAGLIRCVADIFKLSKHDLERMHGYTDYSANKLFWSIYQAKKTTFDRFIMALSIPEVGKSTARGLAQRIFKRPALFDLTTPEKVLELRARDVGEVTAANIAAYFSDPVKRENAEELLKLLDIPEMGEVESIPGVAGKTFVFSGKFSEHREVYENKVLAAGGYVSTTISPVTSYLVVGERAGSKVRKAKVLGIDPIDERVFLSLFEKGGE
jgi:DNA ligase (NAD+)